MAEEVGRYGVEYRAPGQPKWRPLGSAFYPTERAAWQAIADREGGIISMSHYHVVWGGGPDLVGALALGFIVTADGRDRST